MTKKVLLIGWDAADWRVINPLLDAGKMPGLQSIVDNGVMANLATLYPPLSPMMWTSISTGTRPYKHGILGFTEPTADGSAVQPVSVLSRRGKALWNILMQQDYRCNVVGWWPSHPAEPINGVMVSNHYQQAPGPLAQGWPMQPGTVHPRRAQKALANLRFHPDELTAEHILPFIPRLHEIDQDKDPRVASCAKILCEATSVHAAATEIMSTEPWDFMGVYYDAIDHFCHGFMKFHPPRRPHIDEREFELYKNVVTAGYLYHDMMLRSMLELVGEDTLVILVSDHGFHPDHLRPTTIPNEPAGPAVEHRDFGVLAMRGPGIRRDERIYGANLLDVTPTILTYCGLPVGENMDGRALIEAFERPPDVTHVASWDDIDGDDGRHPPHRHFDPIDAKEALEQMVALGYIERPDENNEKAIEKTIRELNYNLARSYMDAGLHARAVPLLAQMHAKEPSEHRLGLHLAMCYRSLGRIPELAALVDEMKKRRVADAERARAELAKAAEIGRQRTLERKQASAADHHQGDEGPSGTAGDDGTTAESSDEPIFSQAEQGRIRQLRSQAKFDAAAFDFLTGCVHVADGNLESAIAAFQSAESAAPERLALHIHIGEAYLQLKDWESATHHFERAIELDPENAHASLGVARALLLRRKNRAAAEQALKAVALMYFFPMAHYCLGTALHRIGRIERAVEALQVAISQNPNFVEAHTRLAHIYKRRLRDPAMARAYQQRAKELRSESKARAGFSASAPLPVLAEAESSDFWEKHASPADTGFARVPRLSNAPTGKQPPATPAEVITIVSGLPRSGTSMMMQMLDAGGLAAYVDGERIADEDNPKGYFEHEQVKRLRKDTAWLPDARGKSVKVIAQLLPALPSEHRYRIIFMERESAEVVASQRRMLERRGETGASLSDDKLNTVFDRQVKNVKRMLQAHHIPTLTVSYRDAVSDPAGTAHEVCGFLGGGLDEAAMCTSVVPDLYRQRAAGD